MICLNVLENVLSQLYVIRQSLLKNLPESRQHQVGLEYRANPAPPKKENIHVLTIIFHIWIAVAKYA